MTNQPTHTTKDQAALLTRDEVIAQIEARLADRIDDAALAKWAFDHFYAEEIGEVDFEPGAGPAIAEALDALMFGDEPSFRLDQDELRALAAHLRL